MKAIAVHPGKPNSIHLRDIPEPKVSDVADGRGVLVRVIRVGVDGTDKEINAADYGAAPDGHHFLVIGHEGFGRVEAVGERVTEVRPGDYVVATVANGDGGDFEHFVCGPDKNWKQITKFEDWYQNKPGTNMVFDVQIPPGAFSDVDAAITAARANESRGFVVPTVILVLYGRVGGARDLTGRGDNGRPGRRRRRRWRW
jgi:hypothetical protein